MVRISDLCFLFSRTLNRIIFPAGGQNSQTLSDAGIEANLDTQYGLGLSFPTPGTLWSTAGSPPFNATLTTPTDSNEPYNVVSRYLPV